MDELFVLSQQCLSLSFPSDDEDDDPTLPFASLAMPIDTKQDLIPSLLLIAHTIQDHSFDRPLKVLFDSGSNISLLNTSCLPNDTPFDELPQSIQGLTAAGNFSSTHTVLLKDLMLPEFSRTKHIQEWRFHLFETKCPYDIIFGRDFLHALKIDPCFSTSTINWDTLSVPFKPRTFWHNPYHVQVALVHTDSRI